MERQPASGNWSIDGDEFVVLVNHDAQYAIWPAAKPIPAGWKQAHSPAQKAECLAFVERRWIDMRPGNLPDRPVQR
ncbi:MbtH family protein [Bradyrhizobium sp. OK095]|jgi:MbtH protein|uniref:MbtH family protein n=1 Tax=Bradyrhizobium sp. OK095 TaxID=1882760 RepID=UPI0008B27B15|nr:MbtH family protein [Bradyrhizobium sp. OK095]SEM65678.1 MbtH protein [Bradyrhizobium sp. OK095]